MLSPETKNSLLPAEAHSIKILPFGSFLVGQIFSLGNFKGWVFIFDHLSSLVVSTSYDDHGCRNQNYWIGFQFERW